MKLRQLYFLLIITLILLLFIMLFIGYWQINPFILLIWFLTFSLVNILFLTNRELIMLLEKEDWPALVRFLEDQVIQKGRYSRRKVRLLANSYLVLSDSAAVMSLENKAAIIRPSLVEANALVFGTARILGKDLSGAVRFFEIHRETVRHGMREWASWYYAYSLLLTRQYDRAGEEFAILARLSKDRIICALSSFFLSEILYRTLHEKYNEYREISDSGRGKVRRALPSISYWNREVSRIYTDIHVAALSRHIEETGRWLYGTIDRT